MTAAILVSIFMTLAAAATPILLAGLGELVTEKAGVLNLGVEGMMLCGAVAGFAVAYSTGSVPLGLLAASSAIAGSIASTSKLITPAPSAPCSAFGAGRAQAKTCSARPPRSNTSWVSNRALRLNPRTSR